MLVEQLVEGRCRGFCDFLFEVYTPLVCGFLPENVRNIRETSRCNLSKASGAVFLPTRLARGAKLYKWERKRLETESVRYVLSKMHFNRLTTEQDTCLQYGLMSTHPDRHNITPTLLITLNIPSTQQW
jgi:hypothetical protein